MKQFESILLPKNGKRIEDLKAYQKAGGLKGLEKARSMSPEEVIAEIKASGLRGRGGAGFPTFIKWNGVRSESSEKKYVVCNGSEGEPGTYKDRYLLSKNPYPLIEGLLIASYAIGVKKAHIGLKKKYTIPVNRVRQAIQEMEETGVCEKGAVEIFLGPDEYLFGEERALIEVLSGGGAMPRVVPTYILGAEPDPIHYNPTVVNNIETFNHATHIMANGWEWFKGIGSEDTSGTSIFTLSGHVKNPGMYELPMGTPMSTLLNDLGGGPIDKDYAFKAAFSGVANTVMTPDMFDTPLDFGSMRAQGTGLGSSGYILFDEGVCMVEVAMIFSGFLAKESCGQCMPCKIGCQTITSLLKKIHKGHGREEDLEKIRLQYRHVTDQTRCFLSTEEQILVSSIMDKFSAEFEAHLGKECSAPKRAFLGKINSFNEETREFEFAEYSF